MLKIKNTQNFQLLLYFIVILQIFLLAISLLKNISYPLLWNDEGETAMYAERILKFGYPKVDDGKNVLNVSETQDKSIAVKEGLDAWIYIASWGQYYFAVPGVFLGQKVDDLYLKTFLARAPFAVIGFLGILIFGLAISQTFKDKTKKLLFMIIYLFIELLSVNLALHLREMRHYSLTVFVSACILFIYIRYVFLKSMGKLTFNILIIFFSLLLLNVYLPGYFGLMAVLAIHLLFFGKDDSGDKLNAAAKRIFPLILSFLLTIPYLIFFEFFYISSEISKTFRFGLPLYLNNIWNALDYMSRFEVLPLLVFVKIVFFILTRHKSADLDLQQQTRMGISYFLTLFFAVYFLILSRIPYFYIRYYILLQPIMALLIVVDLFNIFVLIQRSGPNYEDLKRKRTSFFYLFSIILIFNVVTQIDPIRGHIFELQNAYKGPLDYAILYIKKNFENTKDLVIATNYEEYVYMYYLESKVTVGLVGNNLEEDLKTQPDIIILRRMRSSTLKYLKNLLTQGNYQKITFPVYEYSYNNIPQLGDFGHLFKTPLTNDEANQLKIYVRQKS